PGLALCRPRATPLQVGEELLSTVRSGSRESVKMSVTPIPIESKALTEWQRRHLEWRSIVRDSEHSELDPPRTQAEHIGRTKQLALILYAFSGPSGTCNPGIDRLATEINMGRT